MSKNKPRYDGRPTYYPGGGEPPKRNFFENFRIGRLELIISAIGLTLLLTYSKFSKEINDIFTISDLQEQIDYEFNHGKTNIYVITNENSPKESVVKQYVHKQFGTLETFGIDTKVEHLYIKFINDIPGDEGRSSSVIAGQAKTLGIDGRGSLLLISPIFGSTGDITTHEFWHNQGQIQVVGSKGTSYGYQFNINGGDFCVAFEEMAACYGNRVSNADQGLGLPFSQTKAHPYYIYHVALEELIPNHKSNKVIKYFFNGKNESDIEALFYCISGRHSKNIFDFENLHYLGQQLYNLQMYLHTKTKYGNSGMNEDLLRTYLRESKDNLLQGTSVPQLPKYIYKE